MFFDFNVFEWKANILLIVATVFQIKPAFELNFDLLLLLTHLNFVTMKTVRSYRNLINIT
jgi:hypothetical protein